MMQNIKPILETCWMLPPPTKCGEVPAKSMDKEKQGMPQIELNNVKRAFGNVRALNGVCWTIPCGTADTIALVGPNGAGKTTLLRIACGLLRPTLGEAVFVDGGRRCNVDTPDVRTQIAFVLPGDRNLFFRNTVLENIAYFSAIRKQDPKKISTKLTQYAEQLNMAHLLKTQVGNLSTGERKKASILAGICTDAKLLILDEPSNGLDIDAVLELQSIVSNIRANGTITTILSSHDINMLSGAATKYVYLCKGKIVWQNNGEMEAAEIVEKYRTLVQEGKQ